MTSLFKIKIIFTLESNFNNKVFYDNLNHIWLFETC